MEQYFATIFEDVRHERSLILLRILNGSRYIETIQIHTRRDRYNKKSRS